VLAWCAGTYWDLLFRIKLSYVWVKNHNTTSVFIWGFELTTRTYRWECFLCVIVYRFQITRNVNNFVCLKYSCFLNTFYVFGTNADEEEAKRTRGSVTWEEKTAQGIHMIIVPGHFNHVLIFCCVVIVLRSSDNQMWLCDRYVGLCTAQQCFVSRLYSRIHNEFMNPIIGNMVLESALYHNVVGISDCPWQFSSCLEL